MGWFQHLGSKSCSPRKFFCPGAFPFSKRRKGPHLGPTWVSFLCECLSELSKTWEVDRTDSNPQMTDVDTKA